jgi:hypothetical protein
MHRIETRRSRHLVVAVVLAVAVFACASVQSPDGRSKASAQGVSGRSSQATAVEAQIARTDLAGTMEIALGDEFAGIWFEPSTARVYAGFTSPATRKAIEAVAARAALDGYVIPTPVHSTWAQLNVAQDRWGRRLEDLFARAEVATALNPERNAVTIELGSSVSPDRRISLQRRAAASSVDVLISMAPDDHLRITPQARCAAFVVKEAACELPIVAGVSVMGSRVKKSEIEANEEGGDEKDLEFEEEGEEAGELVGRGRCTAGPAVIAEKPADQATATKTYILVAGHCIDKKWGGGDVGKNWVAYNKKAPAEEKEIGAAIAFLNAATDVGVIEVTTAYWAKANDPIPVTPAVVIWDNTKETEPLPVIDKNTPMLNTTSCISGQVSETNCGKIITLDQKVTEKKLTTENLIEVEKATATKGDSGGPWFSESQYKKGFGYIEGTHVGIKGSTGNPVYQSLDTSFAELKKLKNLDLKLLTKANEQRHLAFKADKYPQTVTSAGGASEDKLTVFGFAMKCTERSFDGEITEPKVVEGKETNALEVTPTYAGCTTNGLLTTVLNNGCKYKLGLQEKVAAGQYKATVDVVCPGGKPGIEILVYSNGAAHESGTWLCKFTVPPQSGLKSVTLTNSSGDIVLDKGTIEAIKAKIHRKSVVCPSSGTENETSGGAYDIGASWTFAGTREGKEVNIEMVGG